MSVEEKKRIRAEIKKHATAMSPLEAAKESARIFAKLEQEPEFSKSNTLFIYWAMPGEVQTRPFIEKWLGKKRIILPVVEGNVLRLKELHDVRQMTMGQAYKIAEPDHGEYFDARAIDLAIVPGLAFDRDGHRLGRGRAYYDRLLKDMYCPKIGVCFSFQLFGAIPVETHDIPMDKVISGH
jgi:5-formyltetrahydrofolate cyclo-ligase